MGKVYLIKIERFLLKILYIKLKVSSNSIIKVMNSIKNAIKLMNSKKNKLNSKINYPI